MALFKSWQLQEDPFYSMVGELLKVWCEYLYIIYSIQLLLIQLLLPVDSKIGLFPASKVGGIADNLHK